LRGRKACKKFPKTDENLPENPQTIILQTMQKGSFYILLNLTAILKESGMYYYDEPVFKTRE